MPRTIPKLVSPAYLVRQKALYEGILGPSKLWKLIAIVVFGRGLLRRFFGKHPEHLGVEKLKAGQTITITSIAAPSRSERKDARRARRRRARRIDAARVPEGLA